MTVEQLPFSFARRFGVLLAGERDGRAVLTCRPGVQRQVLTEVRRVLERPLVLEEIAAADFEARLQQTYEGGTSEAMQVAEDLGDDIDLQSIAQHLPEPEDLLESRDDAPIIRLINGLLTEAVKKQASDIHIEPFENRLRVRFRIDGILREIIQPPKVLAPFLASRIKVMARLDIAEKRLPQDGRISLRIAGRPVDVRVSTIPSGHGERVVLRLLDKQAGRLDLEHLGMVESLRGRFDRIIQRPHGIVLVTGPTGSGKTTSLYAALSRLNDKTRNIMTVEDPIEYYLDGIGQTQVSSKVNMTFARGLRAILRQDPDIVMIGEIRDLETAEIAVQASLTGHLVFSTLHTNTAVGSVTRLRDMGVEPFLLSSSLIGVLAQRLVRLLCPDCKREAVVSTVHQAEIPAGAVCYEAVGCEACNFLGYRGRTGIYEFVEVDEGMRTLINDGRGEHELERAARLQGPDIRQDGLVLVAEGKTSREEIVRVTREDA